MSKELPTFANIIVPLDGSELAESALPVAVAIATPGGSRIHLVTVALTYDIPVSAQMDTLTRSSLTRMETELRARFPGVTQTTLAGDPVQQISQHAANTHADLIVMATHGRSGIRKFLLGSVSDRLLTHSTVPVLLVKDGRGDHHFSPLLAASINRIVLPLDGSEPSAEAAPYAMELARLLGAETVLVYVDEGEGPGRAAEQANAVAGRFADADLMANVREVMGEPGPALAKVASEQEGSIVVMSSLSATGMARGTHRGSVTDYVVKHATAPVLVVRPKGYLGPVVE